MNIKGGWSDEGDPRQKAEKGHPGRRRQRGECPTPAAKGRARLTEKEVTKGVQCREREEER